MGLSKTFKTYDLCWLPSVQGQRLQVITRLSVVLTVHPGVSSGCADSRCRARAGAHGCLRGYVQVKVCQSLHLTSSLGEPGLPLPPAPSLRLVALGVPSWCSGSVTVAGGGQAGLWWGRPCTCGSRVGASTPSSREGSSFRSQTREFSRHVFLTLVPD